MHKVPFLLFLLFFLNACSSIAPQKTQLLLKIEKRDVVNDTILEYRIFTNGILNKTFIHSTNDSAKLYSSEFYQMKRKQFQTLQTLHKQLTELDYHNDFPWKEDFYQRGNVVKFEFLDLYDIAYIPQTKSKSPKQILSPKVFYFYSGHQDSPKLFRDILSELESS
jgi:hypothetical protein